MNLPNNIDGVSYRTQPRSWLDNTGFGEWLSEPRSIDRYAGNCSRNLFVNNCSGYMQTERITGALISTNTEIEFLAHNATHL